ncbi:hypothetical protein AJ88_03635 [Mesorhizobium amorphae CCBAU 01583]|nr:hypothetical protein AJ88_03635 [Mesorhizobium amorphae CCBAU 01583]
MVSVSATCRIAFHDLVGDESEVPQLSDLSSADQDVSRFDISVKHAAIVESGKSQTHLASYLKDDVRRHRSGLVVRLKRTAFAILHDKVDSICVLCLGQIVDLNNVTMPRLLKACSLAE